MPLGIVIEVDDHEKEPLLFPETLIWSPGRGKRVLVRTVVEVSRMLAGDYRLKGAPRGCVIERKAGPEEIATNLLTKDRTRFDKAWDRFIGGCEYPVLLMDCSLSQFGSPRLPKTCKISPADIAREFWELVLGERGPRLVIWAGNTASVVTRRNVGEQLIRLMLTVRECKTKRRNPCNESETQIPSLGPENIPEPCPMPN